MELTNLGRPKLPTRLSNSTWWNDQVINSLVKANNIAYGTLVVLPNERNIRIYTEIRSKPKLGKQIKLTEGTDGEEVDLPK